MDNQELVRYNSQTAVIQLPRFDYINWLLKRNCFEELNELFRDADSPAKEISESYSAYHQLKKICHIGNMNWIHIGDGSRARTAALFSLLTKSGNISIDPQIRTDILQEWINKYDINRFGYIKDRMESMFVNIDSIYKYSTNIDKTKEYGITCVHAHINLEEVDNKFPNWKYLYTSVCCYPSKQKFSKEYMLKNNIIEIVNKLDMNILSERREFAIYKKLKSEANG